MPKKKMVNLTEQDIEQYCQQYKVSLVRYMDEKQKLETKVEWDGRRAYSEEQVNRLIFRNSSKKTVATVIALHEDLINEGLSAQSIPIQLEGTGFIV